MRIDVSINGRRIASATAFNITDLASVSNYQCEVITSPSPFGATPPKMSFHINKHARQDGSWELVRRIAEIASGVTRT